MADAELRQAFAQLQAQMVETQQRVALVEAQAGGASRAALHADVSLQQLALAPGARAFQPVGRCFVLQPTDRLRAAAAARKTAAEDKLAALRAARERLQQALRDSENNLRDMVQQRKEQA